MDFTVHYFLRLRYKPCIYYSPLLSYIVLEYQTWPSSYSSEPNHLACIHHIHIMTPPTRTRQARCPHPMHVAQIMHRTPVLVNPETLKRCAMRHVSSPTLMPTAHAVPTHNIRPEMTCARSSVRSPIRHLPTPLLHLLTPLTRRLRLRHPGGVCIPSTCHPPIRRPRGIHAIHRNHTPQPPRPVTRHCCEEHDAVGPVYHIPHVLGQAFGFEVFAGALEGAIWGKGRAGLALEEELD
jgi:hypothetical protein